MRENPHDGGIESRRAHLSTLAERQRHDLRKKLGTLLAPLMVAGTIFKLGKVVVSRSLPFPGWRALAGWVLRGFPEMGPRRIE